MNMIDFARSLYRDFLLNANLLEFDPQQAEEVQYALAVRALNAAEAFQHAHIRHLGQETPENMSDSTSRVKL